MRLIPVVDVLGGVAVRAVGGRRGEYRPLRSRLVDSVDPVKVARALLAAAGAADLYVADLDAIVHADPNRELLAALAGVVPGRLFVDAGVRTAADLDRVPPAGAAVLGLETLAGPAVLAAAAPKVLSLDLWDGHLFGDWDAWRAYGVADDRDALGLAAAAVERFGLDTLIVLDLARIGGGTGTGTEPLCAEVKRRWPGVEVIAGGGVRDRADLARLADVGVDGVLVATGLHDGTLSPPNPAA